MQFLRFLWVPDNIGCQEDHHVCLSLLIGGVFEEPAQKRYAPQPGHLICPFSPLCFNEASDNGRLAILYNESGLGSSEGGCRRQFTGLGSGAENSFYTFFYLEPHKTLSVDVRGHLEGYPHILIFKALDGPIIHICSPVNAGHKGDVSPYFYRGFLVVKCQDLWGGDNVEIRIRLGGPDKGPDSGERDRSQGNAPAEYACNKT